MAAEHPVLAGYRDLDSASAVQLGAGLADAVGQPLVLACAYRHEVEEPDLTALPRLENEHRFDAADARVARAAKFVPDGVDVRERVLPAERTWSALVALAVELDACALAVGRDRAGDVLRHVLEHAPCPVLVSPFDVPVPGGLPIGTVGVAYDGSPAAGFALAAGAHLAGVLGVRLQVLTVEHGAASTVEPPRVGPADFRRLPGGAGPALVAASDGLDLLLCGAHGHGRLLSALLGSVSSQLVHAAHCPVLVIPPRVRVCASAPLGLSTAAAWARTGLAS